MRMKFIRELISMTLPRRRRPAKKPADPRWAENEYSGVLFLRRDRRPLGRLARQGHKEEQLDAQSPVNHEAHEDTEGYTLCRARSFVTFVVRILFQNFAQAAKNFAITRTRHGKAFIVASLLILAGCQKSEQPQPAPPEVQVTPVEQRDVPIYTEWVGTLDGLVNAQIRPQVTGYLLRQTYQEGSFVKKGQLLFEIDPRTFQAALDQTKAQLANAEQQLAQAQANQVKAQLDVDRYVPLAKEQAVTQQALDNAVQTNLVAQAQVRAAKAQIEAARAQMDAAQLNLGFTKIASLIDGIAGVAQAQIGDLVTTTTLLTTVSTLDPIKVYFPVSEQGYLRYVKENPDAAKRAARSSQLALELVLADGSRYPHRGNFAFADRQVDVRTGTLRVEGLFPNPGNVLRPGQFARVRAVLRTREGALLVPQRAVTELQGSYQVAVVGNDNKVSIRPVKVGERVDTEWIIDEGLKQGEKVVAEGIQRVKAGLTVNPKPFTGMSEAKAGPTAKSAKSEPR
jgi:RND family efflux transporter MFP subunit